MKKLALLLLALPLAACAIPTPEQQRARLNATQLAQAETACSDKPDYWHCVNNFTHQRYGMHVVRLSDGSVFLANDTASLRAAVGKPLQEAQALAAQKNYKAAMAKINEAEAVPNKTADETDVIAQMKDYIAVASSRPSLL